MDTLQVRPHGADLLSLSATIEDVRLISLRRAIPHYPKLADSTPRHSHSIILSHGNALDFQRKFFCARRRTVSPIRQKFAFLNSKVNFDDPRFSRFQRLSVSIGRFSRNLRRWKASPTYQKRPSATAMCHTFAAKRSRRSREFYRLDRCELTSRSLVNSMNVRTFAALSCREG